MVLLTDSEKLSRQLNQASKLTFDLEFTFQKNTIHQIQFSTLKRIIFLAIERHHSEQHPKAGTVLFLIVPFEGLTQQKRWLGV